MASEKYNYYTTRFREESAKNGLRFTLSETLSAIPAAIGHFIDTLLHLNGIFRGSKSHLDGPFGFLLGSIPYAIGFVAGEILQQVLNIPMYIGYYLLDKPIALIFKATRSRVKFDKVMIEGSMLLNGIYGYYAAATRVPPDQMSGFFGFLLGVIPQTIRYGLHRLGEVLTCIPQFLTDKVCSGIQSLYSKIGKAIRKDKKPTSDKAQSQQEEAKQSRYKRPTHSEEEAKEKPKEEVKEEAKQSRYKRPPRSEAEPELIKIEKQNIDLFAVLGIDITQFEDDHKIADKQFKLLSLKCHPDKFPDKKDESEEYKKIKTEASAAWVNIKLARDILSDEQLAKKYIKWYQGNHQPTLFQSTPPNKSGTDNSPASHTSNSSAYEEKKPSRYQRPPR